MGMFTTNAPSAKFAKIGDSVGGRIVDVYQSQRYEYVRGGQGLPLYWLNKKPTAGARVDPATGRPNDPVLQAVITLDTGERDASGDTERRLFIKNKRMDEGVTLAVMLAGAKREGMLLGGYLRCTWTAEEQGDGPQPAHVYEFVYKPPAPGEGRPLSGEVRLADREEPAAYTDNPATPAPTTVGGWNPTATAGEYNSGNWRAPDPAPAPVGGWPGQVNPTVVIQPAGNGQALARAAAASARDGIRNTDVTAGRGPAATYDDEPPF